MSGHSKWATTKHRKAAQDAKRSALFSKLARNITVAAKEGGDPNPDNNASLAAAIEKAKGYSMPKDKIKTAIDKAFGSGKDAANYETVVYEGYGPAGVAVLCEALTDNRNRTAADVRAAFSHSGGNLGTSGSVAFQFDRKGQIMVSKEVETGDKKNPIGPNGAAADEEEFMLAVAEAGGDDYEDADEEWIVYTAPGDLMAVVKELEAQGIQVKGAEMTMIANTPSAVSVADAKKVMRLIDKLEELEDLQNVYHTMDITDEIAAALCRMLGAKKVLWLPRGIDGDETNEHIDNVCAFVRPGEVVLAWTDDPTDPQYACSQACLHYLEGETDAQGRRIRVHKLPIPRVPVLVTQEDLEGYTFEDGEDVREVGERLAASYVNYYCANGAIVLPAFGGENAASDAQAAAILAGLFPERRIISVYAREILTGGGNIHCITQQIPEGAKL